MKLYWGPHTCAIGIHLVLEEIGKPYETEEIDVHGGATRRQPFLSVNPKGKVPTLVRDDGSVLTEFSAIATWLARVNPEKNLLSADPEGEARAVEVMDYVDGTIHGQGFGRMMMPQQFESQDLVHGALGVGQASVKAQGRQMVERGFAILETQLGRHEYALGDTFGIADATLFYAERWAVQYKLALGSNVQRHFERVRARPAARRVLALWGEV